MIVLMVGGAWTILYLQKKNSIEFVQKMGVACPQILKSETYLVGKLTQLIWQVAKYWC
jgi:hypothetical protein